MGCWLSAQVVVRPVGAVFVLDVLVAAVARSVSVEAGLDAVFGLPEDGCARGPWLARKTGLWGGEIADVLLKTGVGAAVDNPL